ncbi:MAG: hypothetical protein RQ754_06330 [Desulfuromonadales bacterium]|nr:hypothetical protein [Desulfuromonadales bacterium]
MMIPVKYADGTFSQVHPHALQDLIVSKRIESFKRSDGWVDVNRDPIRRRRSPAQHQSRSV